MKILADSPSIVQKHTDMLPRAFLRKAGNDTLSSTTLKKFAYIANRGFKCKGYDLGAAFTGRTVPAPPKDNAYANLQVAELRNVIATQRLQLRAGTCMHDYLGDVLKRLPQPQPCALDRWRQSPNPSPQLAMPAVDTPNVNRNTFAPAPHAAGQPAPEPLPDYALDTPAAGAAAAVPKEPKPDYPLDAPAAAGMPTLDPPDYGPASLPARGALVQGKERRPDYDIRFGFHPNVLEADSQTAVPLRAVDGGSKVAKMAHIGGPKPPTYHPLTPLQQLQDFMADVAALPRGQDGAPDEVALRQGFSEGELGRFWEVAMEHGALDHVSKAVTTQLLQIHDGQTAHVEHRKGAGELRLTDRVDLPWPDAVILHAALKAMGVQPTGPEAAAAR